jgi:RimJ/RimL family protein N-acetyltransferase
MILLSDISILSAHDIDVNLLYDFYNKIYPGSRKPEIWKWLNRSSFCDNKIPLIIIYKDRVIGHAGMIPFNVFLDGVKYTASWFIDFALLPEYQKQGLGTVLANKWMEYSDISFTFCNEKSIRVFKQCGWTESFDANIHRYFIRPFDHPRLSSPIPVSLLKIINKVPFFSFSQRYNKYASSIDRVRLNEVTRDSLERLKVPLDIDRTGTIIPVRDTDYMSWRLLNSPDRNEYFIFRIEGIQEATAIIKTYKEHYPYSIDLLWISTISNLPVIRDMIATIGVWSMKQGYSYIRYHVSGRELSDYLKKTLRPIVNKPIFAFFAKDTDLFNQLKVSRWHWDLIDSDFERFI